MVQAIEPQAMFEAVRKPGMEALAARGAPRRLRILDHRPQVLHPKFPETP